MTGLPDFKELVANDLKKRKAVQAENVNVRDQIAAALQAAHEEGAPWKAYPPESEAGENVTKRLNISCEVAFRLHLIIADGGQVTFPKTEAGEAMSINGSANALLEIAQRYSLHRWPDEAVVVRKTIAAR